MRGEIETVSKRREIKRNFGGAPFDQSPAGFHRIRNEVTHTHTLTHTHPCCVLSQVAAMVLHSVGVAQFLEELHFLDDVLPFLEHQQSHRRG